MKQYVHTQLCSMWLFVIITIVISFPPSLAKGDHTTTHTLEQLQIQLQALLSQVANLEFDTESDTITPVNTTCPSFTQTLYRGKRDSETNGEVTKLQELLATDTHIYPEGEITGYFGVLTEKALQRWQSTNNIVTSGTPDSTGYGVFGPKTREAIKNTCPKNKLVSETSPETSNTSPIPPVLASPITTPIRNIPPTIVSITGPTTLEIGQIGTWMIVATDTPDDILSYTVSWGDSVSPKNNLGSFSHAYVKEGMYTAEFSVKDLHDQILTESRTITITTPPVTNNPPTVSSMDVTGTSALSELVFVWTATDANKDNLVWSIAWGDGTTTGVVCSGSNVPDKNTLTPTGWTYTATHSYANAGTYNITATVSDCLTQGTTHTQYSLSVSAPTAYNDADSVRIASTLISLKNTLLHLLNNL